MTIAKLKNNHIECSICQQNPNEGKYFPENIIYYTISKESHESSQRGAFIRMGKILWNPQWKVYQEWEETDVEDMEEEDKARLFAIFCPNCFCEECEKLTIYTESDDKGRQNSYCEGRCLPAYHYWPKDERKEFEKAIKKGKIEMKEEEEEEKCKN